MELLVFQIAESLCGVPIEYVREVQQAVSLSSVPEAGPQVLGAMNLRGQMVLVLELRRVFGAKSKPIATSDHFLVMQCGERLWALRVDQAREFVRIDPHDITESTEARPTAQFATRVVRVGNEFVHLIDPLRMGTLLNATSDADDPVKK